MRLTSLGKTAAYFQKYGCQNVHPAMENFHSNLEASGFHFLFLILLFYCSQSLIFFQFTVFLGPVYFPPLLS